MSDSLGTMYFEVRARADKLKSEMDNIQKEVQNKGKIIANDFQKNALRFNDALAKKSLAEIEQSAIKLRANLERKIQMGSSLAELEALKGSLDKAEGALQRFKKKNEEAEASTSSFKDIVLKSAAALGGMALLHKALDFGKKIVETATEFETLRTRLVSLYGDATKAGEVFDQFKQIAATTPYSLKGVVEAGATIKAFGMNAETTLKFVTDLAAYMGIDVVEAASAVGRAFAGGVGAADILRERGVLNLVKSFKGIDDLTKLTLPEFRKALLDTMVDPAAKIVGSTDRLSKTFGGMMSNMGDALDSFMNKIGTKLIPVFEPTVQRITKMLGEMTSSAVDEFKSLAQSVENTEKNIIPLIGTYSTLSLKTNKSKKDHEELSKTIETLGNAFPAAITQWDNYGRAIEISASKLWDLIKAEKELLKYKNKEAIQEIYNDYGDVKKKMGSLQWRMKKGTYTDAESGAIIPYTTSEIADMQTQLESLGELKRGIEARYKELSGGGLTVNPKIDKPDTTPGDPKTAQKRLSQELKAQSDAIESKQKLQMQEFLNLENSISQLGNEYEKKRGVIVQAYQKELSDAQIHKDKLIREADIKLKLADKEDPVSVKAINDEKQAAINEYNQKVLEAEKKQKNDLLSLDDDTNKQRITAQKDYQSKISAIEKDAVDQQIKNYQLTIPEYEAYLNKFLELKIKALEQENILIAENNKKFGTNNPLIDLNQARNTGQIENKSQVDNYKSGKDKRDESAWEKENKLMAEGSKAVLNEITGGWRSAFSDIISGQRNFGQAMGDMWKNMGAQIISTIGEILIQYGLLQAALGIFGAGAGGIGGFIIKALGGHSGGDFLGTSNGVKKMAGGGSFMVPPGFPNDSFPLMVESGERVHVTPANQVNNFSGSDVSAIVNAIKAMNMNLMHKDMRPVVNVNANIDAAKFTREETLPAMEKTSREGYKALS